MMAERGISVDHATVQRWTVRYAPLLLEQFSWRKPAVTSKWHVHFYFVRHHKIPVLVRPSLELC